MESNSTVKVERTSKLSPQGRQEKFGDGVLTVRVWVTKTGPAAAAVRGVAPNIPRAAMPSAQMSLRGVRMYVPPKICLNRRQCGRCCRRNNATPELRALAHTHVGPLRDVSHGGASLLFRRAKKRISVQAVRASVDRLRCLDGGRQNDATASTVLARSVREAMP